MLAIETESLTKRYGGRAIVRDLNLAVPQGCVFGFLGPNGAGKTTTMRMLLGLLRPDIGSVHLLGQDLRSARLRALRHVGALVESPSLYDHLTGRANLEITRKLLALPATEVDRVMEIVDLASSSSSRVRTYSLGMKQRLALARALLGSPRLLLLDEPMNGLDPEGIIAMRDLIRALPDRIGGTVFVSSHLLGEVEQTATIAALIVAGVVVLQGKVQNLLGGGESIRIDVDDAARAEALLSELNLNVTRVSYGALILRVPAGSEPSGVASFANRLLVEAGIAVSAIAPVVRTLEQVYRDTIANHSEGLTR
ncbi:MAG: ATP-binding cassette domain-containing protein [Sphingomonas sp.]|jgi:ABC-2 type transport system ATP-binding protein|uniref:ABC transporter ATP-binding protein n=1 Tax=Sphingomonas sp. TaxID=28214 RepID=UPI0035660300